MRLRKTNWRKWTALFISALLLFQLLPLSVLAEDGHIAVAAVDAMEIREGGLISYELDNAFTDLEGHALTYSETNPDGNTSTTPIKNGTYYYTNPTAGEYHPVVTAVCENGERAELRLTVRVTPASAGLDSQYNYDETPAESVRVLVTFSSDGIPILGNDADRTPLAGKWITVPYFDLANQGLESFYRYATENGRGSYVGTQVIHRPTAMHLFLYMVGVYCLGLTPQQVTTGSVQITEQLAREEAVLNILGEECFTPDRMNALEYTGSATSTYMKQFWGHDENLMYYRNHVYPLMSPGWGSTSDYMLLSDGDTIDLAMFSDWGFYNHGGFLSFASDTYSAAAGESVSFAVRTFGTSESTSGNADLFHPYGAAEIMVLDEEMNLLPISAEVDENGVGTVTFPDAGTYYLMACGENAGTTVASYAPAVAPVTVTEAQTPSVIPGDVNSDGTANAKDAALTLRYAARQLDTLDAAAGDVNGDGSVNAKDAALILRYAARQIDRLGA